MANVDCHVSKENKVANIELYLLKCTTKHVQETYGRVLKHCKHLQHKTSTRTHQA